MDLAGSKQFGRMVAIRGDRVTSIPLEEVAGKAKTVPSDHEILRAARSLGTIFGD